MQQHEPFDDRLDAGRALARALRHHACTDEAPGTGTDAGRSSGTGCERALVLALPRGGVPVAFPIAQALGAQLDLMLVRKLGLPNQPEYAMGAIGSGGVLVLQPGVPGLMGVTQAEVDAAGAREATELGRRERHYRGARAPAVLAGRCVILVDDGIATGASMLAAVEVARRQGPRHLVLAVPVAAPDTLATLRGHVDEVVCLAAPARFRAVSQGYRKFEQVEDEEVQALLERAWAPGADVSSQPYRQEPT